MRVRTTLPAEKGASGLALAIMGPDRYAVRAVPLGSTTTIGREPEADICLGDTLASRMHARLVVDHSGKIEIEDLGSKNGTLLRGEPVTAHVPAPVAPGEAISIGTTTLIVQQGAIGRDPGQDWGHAYFLGRAEEECRRHQRSPRSFALLRLRMTSNAPASKVRHAINKSIQPSDILASYAPDEYELLLLDRTPEQAESVVARIGQAVAGIGADSRHGLACFPRDGRNADTLLARAGEMLRGHPGEPTDVDAIFVDSAVLAALAQAEKAATRNACVLLLGETGSGKDRFARYIHEHSSRSQGPFVVVDCASIHPNLIESELFGHVRGAFTGATADKRGFLELAPGGTVFLDEIGELPLSVQAKLLRVLETRQLTRLGSVESRPVDVRFVAATNRDLSAEIAAKTFREDLYHRLAVFEIRIPPLRERRKDIVPLAQAFLRHFCREEHRSSVPELAPQTVALLESYPWPGNVRALRNAMERAVAFCPDHQVLPDHLALPIGKPGSGTPKPVPSEDLPALPPAALAERQRMIEALEACAGNQTRAAKKLGMAQSSFSYKLDRYRIPRPRK